MTQARTRLAEVISREQGRRMGFTDQCLDQFVACDRHHWTQATVMDALLDAADPIIRARIEAERDEAQEPFVFDGGVEAA